MHPLGKNKKIKTVFKDSLVSIKSYFIMPKRTSINDVKHLDELNDLDKIVLDKRNEKRADAKKERRNRHYVKVLIKNQIKSNL
jgi:hypothetical protein